MLELARETDWEAVKRLSVQIHDLHAAWRPDIYCHSEEPYPKEAFMEAIDKRLVYVAKLQNALVGYVTLSILEKSGPGSVSKMSWSGLFISAIVVSQISFKLKEQILLAIPTAIPWLADTNTLGNVVGKRLGSFMVAS